ncbi:GntR family transcriptional regulator [Vibrio sp. CAIM 722]|uniref:GntR family transcriptional regulator n=3 Tax=Vibrionaceae TaxID=641 RepID=A0A7X4LIU7_9VIBR|nr:FadR family transcriptional regulator [Vibrio nitrifigilis]MZI92745.1 GntR family transcriptional regulator [Vibrio eleionomae]
MNKQLVPGDCLPSERDLQNQFGTGRGVIREAITALKQKGLIEVKKGQKGGAYIKQIDVANISDSLALFLQQKGMSIFDVAEFRETIDQTMGQLAMVRATPEQQQHLTDTVTRLEMVAKELKPDTAQLAELDRELNILLAEMSHNPIFLWVMRALQQGFSSRDNNLYHDPEFRDKTVRNWRTTSIHLIEQHPIKLQASISRHYELLQACLDKSQA